ncbi:MAG: CRISPR-associated protein Cmr2, partial [Thermosediminibacterales bacterium]|nr:CRISPR-associated protein Cmr2 [Thermosediminibacterales bacterium]
FQLVYIPYDSVMMARKEVKQQMKDDCKLLKELIRAVLEQNGIGAKTKLGWGTAQITQGLKSFSNMGEIK